MLEPIMQSDFASPQPAYTRQALSTAPDPLPIAGRGRPRQADCHFCVSPEPVLVTLSERAIR